MNGFVKFPVLVWTFAFFPAMAWAAATLPLRFEKVETSLYRSARPTTEELVTLKNQYQLTTIIDLEDDQAAIASEKAAAQKLGLHFVSIPMSGFFAPSDQDVNKALEEMQETHSQGVTLLHCQHGRDRTGLLVGLYRVLVDHQNRDQAYNEMKQKGFRPILLGLNDYFWDRTGGQP